MGDMADWIIDTFEIEDLYWEDDYHCDPNLEAQIIFTPYVERSSNGEDQD